MQLPSVLSQFTNLEQIDPKLVAAQSKLAFNLSQIENYVANKQLFPHTIPISISEMNVELAILSQVVKLNSNFFYNNNLKKIIIPEEFDDYYKGRDALIKAVCLGLDLSGVSQIVIRQNTNTNLSGSVVVRKTPNKKVAVMISPNTYTQNVPATSLYTLNSSPCSATIDGEVFSLQGGSLGLTLITEPI